MFGEVAPYLDTHWDFNNNKLAKLLNSLKVNDTCFS